MDVSTKGIHHITAIASDPQTNLDFYQEVLGLRFVKKTVNFDDPGVYHFYFGDYQGNPGSILTFFPIPRAIKGKAGKGQVTRIVFAVPTNSLSFWKDYLTSHDVKVEDNELGLFFNDPEGLPLALSEVEFSSKDIHSRKDIPDEHAIVGFKGAILNSFKTNDTKQLLKDMGFSENQKAQDPYILLTTDTKQLGSHIWLEDKEEQASSGAGTVHHIAFRTKDQTEQKKWQQELMAHHLRVTPVKEREYFKSVYFQEYGEILFEIATDPPGFTADERIEALGRSLQLPDWLKNHRDKIEGTLPEITNREVE